MNTREITYHGETKSLGEWAVEKEIPWPIIFDRIQRYGWSVEKALEVPYRAGWV